MAGWSYFNSTRTEQGMNRLDAALSSVGVSSNSRVAVVTGLHTADREGWLEILGTTADSRTLIHLPEVPPEPTEAAVDGLRSKLADLRPTAIIALGGGSVLDAAKVAASTYQSELELAALMARECPVPVRPVPLIAIPTTAGSGSEATPFAVLTSETGLKRSLPSPNFYPDVAILDALFVRSLPKAVIADAGIDALAHSLEACWSTRHNPISDALAVRAAVGVLKALPRFFDDPSDAEAANAMQINSNLAGYAFSNTFTAACHALSFPLSARLSLTHGSACGVTLDRIAEINSAVDYVETAFGEIGRALGCDAVEVVREIARVRDHVMPDRNLAKLGLAQEDREFVARNAFAPLMANNPLVLDAGQLEVLLTASGK